MTRKVPKIKLTDFVKRGEQIIKQAHLPADIDPMLASLAFVTSGFGRLKKEITKILNKRYGATDYEVFEFYGDAITHHLIRQRVFERYAHYGPRVMTYISSQVEKNHFFAHLMLSRGMEEYLYSCSTSYGMGRKHPLLADVFEAMVGIISYHFVFVECDPGRMFSFLNDWLFNFWNIDTYIEQTLLKKEIEVEVPEDVVFKKVKDLLASDSTAMVDFLIEQGNIVFTVVKDELNVIYRNKRTSVQLLTVPCREVEEAQVKTLIVEKLSQFGIF